MFLLSLTVEIYTNTVSAIQGLLCGGQLSFGGGDGSHAWKRSRKTLLAVARSVSSFQHRRGCLCMDFIPFWIKIHDNGSQWIVRVFGGGDEKQKQTVTVTSIQMKCFRVDSFFMSVSFNNFVFFYIALVYHLLYLFAINNAI